MENGDHLDGAEFLRRYEAMPDLKKAELIEGKVFVGSPVSVVHSRPDGLVQTWLGTYSAHTPGTECLPNTTIIFDSDNVYQPDTLLRLLPERGGRTQVNSDDYLVGPPELVVEIVRSGVSIALHEKLAVYRRSGVREYLVWRVIEERFDWLCLEGNDYHTNAADQNGIVHSRVFPGLDLNVPALLAMKGAEVLATLQAGLASPAHSAFVNALK